MSTDPLTCVAASGWVRHITPAPAGVTMPHPTILAIGTPRIAFGLKSIVFASFHDWNNVMVPIRPVWMRFGQNKKPRTRCSWLFDARAPRTCEQADIVPTSFPFPFPVLSSSTSGRP